MKHRDWAQDLINITFKSQKVIKYPFYYQKEEREKQTTQVCEGTLVILSLSFIHLRYVSLILKRSKIVSVSLIMERRKYKISEEMGL